MRAARDLLGYAAGDERVVPLASAARPRAGTAEWCSARVLHTLPDRSTTETTRSGGGGRLMMRLRASVICRRSASGSRGATPRRVAITPDRQYAVGTRGAGRPLGAYLRGSRTPLDEPHLSTPAGTDPKGGAGERSRVVPAPDGHAHQALPRSASLSAF